MYSVHCTVNCFLSGLRLDTLSTFHTVLTSPKHKIQNTKHKTEESTYPVKQASYHTNNPPVHWFTFTISSRNHYILSKDNRHYYTLYSLCCALYIVHFVRFKLYIYYVLKLYVYIILSISSLYYRWAVKVDHSFIRSRSQKFINAGC